MRNALAVLLWLAALVPGQAMAASPADRGTVVSPHAMAQALANGKARVLVALRSPTEAADAAVSGPEGRMRAMAANAAAAEDVLAHLPATGYQVRRRFALVPAIAIEADAMTLRRLAEDPAVLRVDIDAPGQGHGVPPDEASVLNNVAMLPDWGLDGSGHKVAIIDTGYTATHPDLAAQLVDEQCFCSNTGPGGCCPNRQRTQSGPGSAVDDNGHGTNVSGIIVGAGNIAPRGAVPKTQVVAVKVLDARNSFCCTSDIVAAMDWVATHHPDVDAVNMSLGTFNLFAGHCDGAVAYTQAMAMGVDALRAVGAVVTASNGNQASGSGTAAPACLSRVVGVGATWDFSGGEVTYLGCTEPWTEPMKPTCFSNHSSTTDLYAAGAFVLSAGRTGGTSNYGGTSMAAPMVASCAIALAQAVPSATAQERIDAMRQSPRTVTHGQFSYPFLDCGAALLSFIRLRACAADAGTGAPTCCGPGELDCSGGVRKSPQASRALRPKAHADSTVY